MPIISPSRCRSKLCSMNPPIKNKQEYTSWYNSASNDERKDNSMVTDCDQHAYYCMDIFECPICADKKPFVDFYKCPNCEGEVCLECENQMDKCPYCRMVKFPELKKIADDNEEMEYQLIQASENGNISMVRSLLNQNVNIHIDDEHALLTASNHGHLEIVRLLLDHGADVHARHDDAIVQASSEGHLGVVRLLIERGADVHAWEDLSLIRAAIDGYLEIVHLLLDNGADMNAQEGQVLTMASINGNFDIMRLLLDRGADVHADHDYAIIQASRDGPYESVRLLLEYGANVPPSAVKKAFENGHTEIARLLMSHAKAN